MKSVKTKILIILTLLILTILILNVKSFGANTTNPKYIGITELKLDSGFGYAIGDPNAGGSKIWNLIEYESESSSAYSENNIYCLKAGVGFTNVDKKARYNVYYDMKTEKTNIAAENNILKNLVEGKIQLDNGTTINQYSAILAILDMFYYDDVSNINYKEKLLDAAQVGGYQYQLTNDDIEAVQQAALWYFTNYDENTIYNQYNKSGWLNYTENALAYTSLSDYELGTKEGTQRQLQAEILYNYLIRTAIENAPNYDNIENTEKAPIQLDTKTLSYEIQGDRTIIGPIHITQNNIKTYNLEFITKINNSETSDYIFLDQNKEQLPTETTANDLVGQDFYISLPLESTIKSKISIEVNIEYDETNLTLWASTTNADEQPIVIPETEKISIPNKLEIDIPDLEGEYEIEIVKIDSETKTPLSGAIFNVNGENKTATNASGILSLGTIQITDTSTPDTYTIKETTGPEGYNKFTGSIELSIGKKIENGKYVIDTANTTMTVKDSHGTPITQNIPVTIDKTTGKITITVNNEKIEGNYELEIVKIDSETKEPLSGAIFNVNGENKTATNASGIVSLGTIQITDISTPDTYTIKETTGPEGYNKFTGSIEISVRKKIENGKYLIDTANTTMTVKDSNGTPITENIPVTIDKTTGKITITVDNEKIKGNYNLEIVKVDSETKEPLSGAIFNINSQDKTATNSSGIVSLGTIQITDISTPDIYTIKETTGPEGYNKFTGSIELSVAKKIENEKYVIDTANTIMTVKDSNGTPITGNIPVTIDKTTGKITITVDNEKIEGNYVVEIVKKEQGTDIALPGAIFNVNGENREATNSNGILSLGTIEITRIDTPDNYIITETSSPEGYNKFTGSIELSVAKKMEDGAYIIDTENTTMIVKDSSGAKIIENVPVTINKTTGRITIEVENEKIVGDYELEIVKVDSKTGAKLSGAIFNVNGEDKTATNTDGILNLGTTQITGTTTKDAYVIKEKIGPNMYNKFDGTIELNVAKKVENGKYIIDAENTTMVVKDKNENQITQNIPVTIDKTTGKITITVENVKKEFDLALRKFIVAVSRDENIEEDEYLRNEDGSYSRAPVVDASKLNTIDASGNKITTATYNHTKEPVEVRKGDTVIYTIRVYNEAEIAGYAQTITDYLPDELEFLPEHEINQKYEWTIEGNRVTTDYLSKEKETEERKNLIEAFDETRANEEEALYYKEVQIACKVRENAKRDWKITNLAQITEDADENGNDADDRDSIPDGGFEEPEGEERPKYKDEETGEYIPGQEDDDDFEKVIIKEFDLALRKFIIAVSNDETIEDDEYLRNEDSSYSREPVVDTSLLNTEDEEGNLITTAIYNHTKEPVLVQKNDIVIYMLRVYNEGDIDGYATEIKDHLPSYLEYVDGEFNDKYGWKVSDDRRTLITRYLEDSLISKPELNKDGKYELSYQEVPVMCRVIESAPTNENITNIADITEYQDDKKEEAIDRDSESDNVELPKDEDLPTYKDEETGEYIPGQQDDDDFEKVIVKEFDLALRKWVTEAIVIENGKEMITATGHQPYDDPEEIVKVELHRKKLNQVTVKFRYSIRVINEGDIPGYVKEITDYIPQGLKFEAADNPGWTDEGNNVISTKLPQDILLQPGEYTEVEVVLTWINDENNMGVMTNIAEISEDDNDYDLPDKDSTPDNQKEGEDDIDDAPVMISISTGKAQTYFMLGGILLVTIAGGIMLIKKFVI